MNSRGPPPGLPAGKGLRLGCEGGEGEGGERAGGGAVQPWGGGRAMGRREGGDGDGAGGLGLDEQMLMMNRSI